MDYKRILIFFILFALLIATTSVAFASGDADIVDDESDIIFDDDIADIAGPDDLDDWDDDSEDDLDDTDDWDDDSDEDLDDSEDVLDDLENLDDLNDSEDIPIYLKELIDNFKKWISERDENFTRLIKDLKENYGKNSNAGTIIVDGKTLDAYKNYDYYNKVTQDYIKYTGEDANQCETPQMAFDQTIIDLIKNQSGNILPNSIPKEASGFVEELINNTNQIDSQISSDSKSSNMISSDSTINDAVKSVSRSNAPASVINVVSQSVNQSAGADDANSTDNNLKDSEEKAAEDNSSQINYGIIGLILIVIVGIFAAYKKFN